MIDFQDYEDNKGQRCLDKWMKVPAVRDALLKLGDTAKAAEVAVKLEDARVVLFNRDGKDKFMDSLVKFVEEA